MRFVLIHGGFHGAWCWQQVVPELERLGHTALAVDLPGHGARRDEDSTLANRRQAIVDVLEPGDILVGHSGGGYDITLAADAAPDRIACLIYLAAGLPIEGEPLVNATGGRSRAGRVARLNETISPAVLRPNERGYLEWIDQGAAIELFYHDCPRETAEWAYSHLSPAPPGILLEPVSLPRFWTADLPRSFIICTEDRALPFASAMATAGRLGVIPHFIEGSHSPFFSRPRELAGALVTASIGRTVAHLRPH